MGMTADEKAAAAMDSTWKALEPVKAQHDALYEYLLKGLPPNAGLDEESWNIAAVLVQEFNRTWPYRIPTVGELVAADRAGRLQEVIDEINQEFRDAVQR